MFVKQQLGVFRQVWYWCWILQTIVCETSSVRCLDSYDPGVGFFTPLFVNQQLRVFIQVLYRCWSLHAVVCETAARGVWTGMI